MSGFAAMGSRSPPLSSRLVWAAASALVLLEGPTLVGDRAVPIDLIEDVEQTGLLLEGI